MGVVVEGSPRMPGVDEGCKEEVPGNGNAGFAGAVVPRAGIGVLAAGG